MTKQDLAYGIGAVSPEMEELVGDHVTFHKELLIRVLLREVFHCVLEIQAEIMPPRPPDLQVVGVLSVLADRLVHGDQDEANAIADSFLAYWGTTPAELAMRAVFPAALEVELRRLEGLGAPPAMG